VPLLGVEPDVRFHTVPSDPTFVHEHRSLLSNPQLSNPNPEGRIVLHVAVNPENGLTVLPKSDVNLRSTLVPDDVLSSGTDVPENSSSKAVELVVVPSYIHNLSQLASVSKAVNETVTDAASATTIAW
jgi:hypothetical protein